MAASRTLAHCTILCANPKPLPAIRIKFCLMKTIKRVVRELRREKNRVQSELQRISNALDALQRLSRNQLKHEVKKVRKFSAATRKKMAAAQRARWAKLKKAI